VIAVRVYTDDIGEEMEMSRRKRGTQGCKVGFLMPAHACVLGKRRCQDKVRVRPKRLGFWLRPHILGRSLFIGLGNAWTTPRSAVRRLKPLSNIQMICSTL
jgi:hypothetical protein